ncbi:guanylate kinase [Xenococcus sp. PCC 7305]|uniref:guanylate kinase n=1 Tax=Xenococcus sp. PCC 7305 TaxID=102125 RepID=UPI0002AC1F85|nr:guanylate kinase [Xenococcus sp. PCC 7305]ELS01751.1 guanylate kinase [Xenococcus sp. PCC 7305]
MASGKLIVITGPSGVGKGTIVRSLIQTYSQLHLSVSATTRKPRPGEIDGRDYYFLNRDEFQLAIVEGEFLEWAEYAGNYYGTPQTNIQELIDGGKWVLLEIELVGARIVSEIFPDALKIFLLPPSMAELEARLRRRGKDPESAIEKRLHRAKEEIAASEEFEVRIVNQDLKTAIDEVAQVIFDN